MMRKVLAGGLILAILLPLCLFSAEGQSNPPPIPIAPIGAHPRLLITPGYLSQTIESRIDDNAREWRSFRAYVDSEILAADAELYPEAAVKSLGLVWLVTGDAAYYEPAITLALNLVNGIEDAPVMTRTNGQWDERFLRQLAALALAYDWMYGLFRSEDRIIISDVLARAALRLRDARSGSTRVWVAQADIVEDGSPDTYFFQAFNREGALWLWAMTATALALQGENINAIQLTETARNFLMELMLPALELQPNGAWAAGPVDGFTGGWWLVQTALAWWTARGEHYFDDSAWWVERMAALVALHYPAFQPSIRGDAVFGYPAIIGEGERNSPDAAYGHTQEMLLATIFPESVEAGWANWVANQITLPEWLRVESWLWHDAEAPAEVPDLLTWRTLGTNQVFMRDRWTDNEGIFDPTATVVTFQAGDHFSPRQFFDQGNFTIWRDGAELVTRGGVFSGGDSNHDANYYARTVAGNTILVCDLAEIFDGIWLNKETGVWLNDCGQRTTGLSGLEGINAGYWLANRAQFDTANIVRAYDDGEVTYIQSDLTAAYNSTDYTSPTNAAKVESVLRELVYIRPGTVLVYDRVETLSVDFTALQTFHFNSRPQFNGTTWTMRDGSSALYVQHLVPEAQIRPVEGYITAGQLIESRAGQPRSGWYRLDIYPPAPTETPWFLTTFVVTANTAPPPLVAALIVGDGMRGTVLSTPTAARWQVMFDDDPQDITAASFVVEPGVEVLFLTGLVPERAYRVQWSDGRVERQVTHGAGSLLLESVSAGVVEVGLGG